MKVDLKSAFLFWLSMALLAMALFPASAGAGSFQAVNGPTTVFEAWRAVMWLMWLLVSVGLQLTAHVGAPKSCGAARERASLFAPLLC